VATGAPSTSSRAGRPSTAPWISGSTCSTRRRATVSAPPNGCSARRSTHWPDLHTPAEETAQALDELAREGKIRHVGVSNYGVAEMEELRRFGRL
jgi:hypothetical protein